MWSDKIIGMPMAWGIAAIVGVVSGLAVAGFFVIRAAKCDPNERPPED